MFGDRRYRFVLLVALLVAAIATLGVYRVIDGMRANSRVATQNVVVAALDVTEGATLTPEALAVVQLPLAAIPAGAFQTTEEVAGRVTRIPVFKGEAIVPGRLAPEGTAGGLEVKIQPGKRAMSVRIDEVAGLSGLVQPNSRVDVMVTTRDDEEAGQVAKLFMSNMRVLSIGAQVTRGADGRPINAPTATLEVTPEEAERLALATREGAIQLVLRGYGDPDSITTDGAKKGDILSQMRDAEPPRPAPAPRRVAPRPVAVAPAPTPAPVAAPDRPDSIVVKVYRGENLSQLKFEEQRDSLRRDSLRRANARRPDSLPPRR